MSGMKNIEKGEILALKELIAYQPGQVVSRTLAQNDAVSVTLFLLIRTKRSVRMNPAATRSLPAWREWGRLRLTGKPTSCTRVNLSLCRLGIPMRYMVRSSLKCCWLSCSKREKMMRRRRRG